MASNRLLLDRPSTDQVGALARQGAVWSMGFLIVGYVLSLGATAVLSRLLLPRDYGIAGMATALISFSQIFSDLGLGWATIQRSEITEDQVTNLFWLSTGFGMLLWMACAATGPLLNLLFHQTELAPIASVAGCTLFLGGMSAQPIALLRRQMRVKLLTLLQIVSTATGALVGIAMAFRGWSYWSLIGQALATQSVLLVLIFGATRFHIGKPRRGASTGSLLAFGGFLAGYNILSYLAKNLDNFIVARELGPEQLGLYTRAYFLMTLPGLLGGGVSSTVDSALAALRHSPARLAAAYTKSITAVAYLAFPLSAGLAVTARELVSVFYGPRWAGVAPLLFWLSIGGIFISVHCFTWLYVVCNKERAFFIWGFVPLILLATGFLIGVHWGTIGVAISYAIVMSLLVTPLGFYFAHRRTGVPLMPTIKGVGRPFFAAMLMAVLVWICGRVAERFPAGDLTILLIKVAAGALTYILICGKEVKKLIGPRVHP